MSDVAKGPNLQLRGNTWYYRRRVPAPLVSILGCNEIKRSLGVTSLTAAKRLRSLEDVKTDALFAAAEAKLHNHAQHPELLSQSDISTDMLAEYVRETVERLDKRNAQRLLADPMESQEQQRDVSMDNQIGLQILLNPSDPRGDELIDPLGTHILKELGVHLDPSTSDFTQFWALVRRGLIELYRRKNDRLHDRYDVAYHDNLFDPDRTPTVRFVELVKIYLQEKEDEYRLNGVSQKRRDKVIAVAATIQDIVGGEWPDPIGWSGFNLSSCSALGLLPGQMTVLLRLLAQAR